MYANELKLLLARGGITPGNVGPLAELCRGWFKADPNLATFILRAIFRELYLDWDVQAVPTAEYTPFEVELLPRLTELANLLASNPGQQPNAALADLVKTYRDCCAAATPPAPNASVKNS